MRGFQCCSKEGLALGSSVSSPVTNSFACITQVENKNRVGIMGVESQVNNLHSMSEG